MTEARKEYPVGAAEEPEAAVDEGNGYDVQSTPTTSRSRFL